VSFLFVNPGERLRPAGSYGVLTNDPELPFYRALHREAQSLVPSAGTVGLLFAPLPYDALHVTALDGINAGNLHQLASCDRERAHRYLARLPEAIGESAPFEDGLRRPLAEHGLTQRAWALAFAVHDVVCWGDRVVAARLRLAPQAGDVARGHPAAGRPAEGHSAMQRRWEAFLETRFALQEDLKKRLGLVVRHPFEPHVTLGYFTKPCATGTPARDRVQEVLSRIAEALQGFRLRLSRVRLYGFTDMATYVRAL
jgi:hypothetical protein